MSRQNLNNCATCDHKRNPDGGHCYMFRLAPTTACVQHTYSVQQWRAMRMQYGERVAAQVAARNKG